MVESSLRVAIVGAASLLGKELADELIDSALAGAQIILLDEDDATGQIIETGDEATVINRLEEDSFSHVGIVFFAGNPISTAAHWHMARQAGASIVDMTDALTSETSVLVRAPWLEGAFPREGSVRRATPDLNTPAVVAAHPAAVILALIAARLGAIGIVRALAATVLEPASQHGRLAMDELHQQTVKLLQFQSLPKEEYDTQIAFNLLPRFEDAAKVDLSAASRRIISHYERLSEGRLAPVTIQLIHAPVFHGYAMSLFVELAEPVELKQVEAALGDLPLDLVAESSDPPSNLAAAGQEHILLTVSAADDTHTRFWIWIAADNLKLAAHNAIACALELRRLRPTGKVQ